MDKVFVDTDVLIDYSKGYSKDLEKFFTLQEKGVIELYINPIVVAEFFTDKNLRKKEMQEKAVDFLSQFTLMDITKTSGFTAGTLLRERNVSYLGDAFIAATCLAMDFKLFTRNRMHFVKVFGLSFYLSQKS